MPTHRMHRGLVALSASAVAAIYMAGYLRTQAADATIAAADVPTLAAATSTPIVAAAAPATATPAPRPTLVQRSAPPARTAPTPQPAAAPATTAQYKDGTYTGQGTSRRGDVWVSLQVQGRQITNVTITRSTLQYPLRDIAK